MMVRWSGCILCALAMVGCTGEQAVEEAAARKTALAFYDALTEGDEQSEELLGLTEYRLYGFPLLAASVFGIPAEVHLEGAERPESGVVSFTFWVKGTDASGDTVKQRRRIHIALVADRTSQTGWAVSVSGTRFDVLGELTLLRQIVTLVVTHYAVRFGFIVSIILLLVFVGTLTRGNMFSLKVGAAAGGFLMLPLSVYVVYVCFGSLLIAIGLTFLHFVYQVIRAGQKAANQE